MIATRRTFYRFVIITGITIILAVTIDLFIFFVLDIKSPGYKPERFFNFSPFLGWFHRPSSEGYWYRYENGDKFYVRTNRYGFADSDRQLRKTRPRIALIGDSTTQFWEAEEENRGQYVIETMLRGRFEVLNFGVRGYGTDQTYLLFSTIGLQFEPDIVIYTFCINDIMNNATTSSKPYFVEAKNDGGLVQRGYPIERTSHTFAIQHRLLDRSFFFRKGRSLLARFSHSRVPPKLDRHFELRPYKSTYNEEDSRRLSVTLKLIIRLGEFVKSRGMKFLVVEGLYRPVFDEQRAAFVRSLYGDVFDFNKVTRLLAERLEDADIEFLSLPTTLKEQGLSGKEFMAPWDPMHLNDKGIKFFSEAVVNKLQRLNMIYE